MGKIGPKIAPAAMLPLTSDEFYAGTSRWDWEKIGDRLRFFRPVELDDLEPEDQSCDICRESFGPGPADDGKVREKPVSLPCNHIFGKDCISDWIATCPDSYYLENVDVIGEPPEWSIDEESMDIDMLWPKAAVWFKWKTFTCPTCRTKFLFPTTSEEQATAIETRLRFWDSAYEKLGIVRSIEEEVCRHDLEQFVEETKSRPHTVRKDHVHFYEMCARVSAMRFALRRARWNLTPVQAYLRDALFNLGCHGITDPSTEYCAEWYDNRTLPLWCWQFEQIERCQDPAAAWWSHNPGDFLRDWEQKRLGPWRRTLFAELEEDRMVWGSLEFLYDWYESNVEALDHLLEENATEI